jgi:hypothetical protein
LKYSIWFLNYLMRRIRQLLMMMMMMMMAAMVSECGNPGIAMSFLN